MSNQNYFKKSYCYNARRYSRPWAAEVVLDGIKLNLFFISGSFAGEHQGGNGEGELVIKLEANKVYAYGQKDCRGGNTESNYFATNENLEITNFKNSAEARSHLMTV